MVLIEVFDGVTVKTSNMVAVGCKIFCGAVLSTILPLIIVLPDVGLFLMKFYKLSANPIVFLC